jgi:hypothetical protein
MSKKTTHKSWIMFKETREKFRGSRQQRQKEDAAARKIQHALQLRKAAKNARLIAAATAKVDVDNKIGVQPQGWHREVALALQRGIAVEETPAKLVTKLDTGSTVSSASRDFRAVEPDLFRRIRLACGLSSVRYSAVMCLQGGQTEPSLRLVSSTAASGKSGAFFFLSPDQQCIIKSCTQEDWDTLLKILPRYVERFEDARAKARNSRRPSEMSATSNNTQPRANRCPGSSDSKFPKKTSGFMETLLPRYLGLYELHNILGDKSKVQVVVMLNVFGGSKKIHYKYDIKGSTAGREASKKELAKTNPVLKDLDWLKKERVLALDEAEHTRMLTALQEDVRCLQSWNLMDYSLLVGIHKRDAQDPAKYEVMPVVLLEDKDRIAYIGIVDILTVYRLRKRAETFFSSHLRCGRNASCQHPEYYGSRFLLFVSEHVVSSSE